MQVPVPAPATAAQLAASITFLLSDDGGAPPSSASLPSSRDLNYIQTREGPDCIAGTTKADS